MTCLKASVCAADGGSAAEPLPMSEPEQRPPVAACRVPPQWHHSGLDVHQMVVVGGVIPIEPLLQRPAYFGGG